MRQKDKFQAFMEKGREFGKTFFSRLKLWRVPTRKKSCDFIRGIIASEVCLLLCLFHFYTEFFIFHASVAVGLRQAVCKTVARF
jgi:hypothetical protein